VTSAEIDAFVLSQSYEQPLRFNDVYIGLRHRLGHLTPDRRKIDRSLQRLRKAGKAFFAKGPGGGWHRKAPSQGA
jgi:hypothetical protein